MREHIFVLFLILGWKLLVFRNYDVTFRVLIDALYEVKEVSSYLFVEFF